MPCKIKLPPTIPAFVTRGKPGRHEAAIDKKPFLLCKNCGHYSIVQWHNVCTGGMHGLECWTCCSKDVVRMATRPIPTTGKQRRSLGINKLVMLLRSKGVDENVIKEALK